MGSNDLILLVYLAEEDESVRPPAADGGGDAELSS